MEGGFDLGNIDTSSRARFLGLDFCARCWLLFPKGQPPTLAICAFTALLAREPEAVSLSNHRIARDAPAKLLRNRASRLPGKPKARQQLRL
jgi:hypothetical protein